MAAGLSVLGGIFAAGFFLNQDEEEESDSPHERNFQDLQDGDWDSNVEFESPIDDLEAGVYQAGSMSDGSLETNIDIEGELQYTGRDLVTIEQMDMRWMMGESAIADEASVRFGNGIQLSNSNSCDAGADYSFDVNVSVSGIQGADTLVLSIPDSEISVSSTC